MRVTNSMLTSRMMLNINKNMRRMDTYYNQLATTKKINFPSDDPILASRAIKFRSMVTETEQYQRNVSQGLSWMELTEYAYSNVLDIFKSISELSISGASDQNAFDDRQKIAGNIKQYLEQLSAEMNITYAGRYVFSGYRTDQPATYEEEQTNDRFTITQNFEAVNIEKIKSYQKFAMEEPTSYEVEILKLAYKGVEPPTPEKPGDPQLTTLEIEIDSGVPIDVVMKSSSDPDAYVPDPTGNTINVVQETGELVLNENVALLLHNGSKLSVTYDKEGFSKGDLNPRVYFECVEDPLNGNIPKWNNPDSGYTMDNHNMQIEFGVNSKITINSLAKNSFTDKLYADLRSLVDLLENIELSDEEALRTHYTTTALAGADEETITNAVNEQLTRERQRITDIVQTKFSNMIGIIQRESSSTSSQRTDLGTRMNRLELISERLIDSRLSYKKLLSDNEDADIVEVSYLLNEASNIYQASLQAGAGVVQLTLANFIR